MGEISTRSSPDQIFRALQSVVPAAQAGLFSIVRLDDLGAMVNHPILLPKGMLEEWMASQRDTFELSLRNLFSARDGETWGAHDVGDKARSEIRALRDQSIFGVGDAVGYKVMRTESGEHILFALLTEHGEAFDPESRELLKALNDDVQRAVALARVPLIATEDILSQLVRETEYGYLCVSTTGRVLECNRVAHVLLEKYNPSHEPSRDKASTLLANMKNYSNSGSYTQIRGHAQLCVTRHTLARGVHALSESVVLYVLKEMQDPFYDLAKIAGLTRSEVRVARDLVSLTIAPKEIVLARGMSDRTAQKHAGNIYKKTNVSSREELRQLIKRLMQKNMS